jgi:hypothetical protein
VCQHSMTVFRLSSGFLYPGVSHRTTRFSIAKYSLCVAVQTSRRLCIATTCDWRRSNTSSRRPRADFGANPTRTRSPVVRTARDRSQFLVWRMDWPTTNAIRLHDVYVHSSLGRDRVGRTCRRNHLATDDAGGPSELSSFADPQSVYSDGPRRCLPRARDTATGFQTSGPKCAPVGGVSADREIQPLSRGCVASPRRASFRRVVPMVGEHPSGRQRGRMRGPKSSRVNRVVDTVPELTSTAGDESDGLGISLDRACAMPFVFGDNQSSRGPRGVSPRY